MNDDREVGQNIIRSFQTLLPSGALTTQFRNVTDTGDPVIQVLRLSDNTKTATGVSLTLNKFANGHHEVRVNTSASATFYRLGEDYKLQITDGAIHNGSAWVNVTGQAIPGAGFNLQNTSSGKLLDRAVKVPHGTVQSASPRTAKQFVLQIANAGTAANYYRGMILQFQPGSVNQGLGRSILESTTSSGLVTVRLVTALPQLPNAGDVAVIIPEEQPLPIGVCHITALFLPTTQIYARWTLDGTLLGPDSAPVCNVWNANTGALVVSNATMALKAPGQYYYDAGGKLIAERNAAHIKVSAVIDGVAYNWERSLPYVVN